MRVEDEHEDPDQRGADLLKSTARQVLLYRALNLDLPDFYHCDLVRDEAGVRLAKRNDALSIHLPQDAAWERWGTQAAVVRVPDPLKLREHDIVHAVQVSQRLAARVVFLLHDDAASLEVALQICDWIAANPYAHSVNWGCTMEAAMRVFTLAWLLRTFGDAPAWRDGAFRWDSGSAGRAAGW